MTISFLSVGLCGKENGKVPTLEVDPNFYIYMGMLVVLGFNGPLRQYFSLYRAVSQREGERVEKG